ncbi:hypothetical protein EJB05_56365 [Eragrostis curvula]|uniref:Neprosin PEP catalytic domain-containing protein n=1 Tax=Eragrostis curvula TaxID=38414 RepID=A0A5J9SGH9_9POAL|nr:hypothetical protein EJB05_56365 [Eragrostis curvula]
MGKSQRQISCLSVLLLVNTITGGCFPSYEQKNLTMPWPSETHPQFYWPSEGMTPNQDSTAFIYATSHVWFPGSGNNYYGAEATLDVYGLSLEPGQFSQAGIWIVNRGDGQPSSLKGIQAGWHVSPAFYNDSRTHFFTDWTNSGADKDCTNMHCPGFHKTSSSVSPGDVINPVSGSNGDKKYITIRLLKDKSTGDWHVHYGFNGPPKPVGYFPKSLLTGLVGQPVEISFCGLVYHRKPKPSPPMGNGNLPSSGGAASFSGLKLIDEDGNDHPVTTDMSTRMNVPACYPITSIDSGGRFFYGGPGCQD